MLFFAGREHGIHRACGQYFSSRLTSHPNVRDDRAPKRGDGVLTTIERSAESVEEIGCGDPQFLVPGLARLQVAGGDERHGARRGAINAKWHALAIGRDVLLDRASQ